MSSNERCAVQRCATPRDRVRPQYFRGDPEAAYLNVCSWHSGWFEGWKSADEEPRHECGVSIVGALGKADGAVWDSQGRCRGLVSPGNEFCDAHQRAYDGSRG